MADSFDLEKLITDVFAPQPGEKVLVVTDLPHGDLKDHEGWQARRQMAEEWRSAFEQMGVKQGFSVYPMLTYPATGAHNSDLPEAGELAGKAVRLDDVFSEVNVVVALTECSASAPLIKYSLKYPRMRAASMPKVKRSMQNTALAADYSEVARKSHILAEKLDRTDGVRVVFSTGHQLYLDLRNRKAEADDGQLHVDKKGMRLINLPSGEACIAPYEGELEGQPSKTEGTIPADYDGELVLYEVKRNNIVEVVGDGPKAREMRDYLAVDAARRNIAELGLGCNDRAVISGTILEDEKVLGMHWAYGRSDHIGGVTGVAEFSDPAHVVHQDTVYARGGPVEVASLVLEYEDGSEEEIINKAEYTIF
jgi:leucyl aminopeptidase (aminopeptidase T)